MKIYRPSGLNELGGRDNNEDAVFPNLEQASPRDRLFIVCDGVGGSAKGEVASNLICRQFDHYFSSNPVDIDDDGFIMRGLKSVEEKLSEHQSLYPETEGMASTLTLLYLDDSREKGLVAWVGDSRVYQIRDGKIVFKSKDHSEVQSLLDMGEITQEEAKTHPRRNVILRAVSGQERPARVDQVVLADIEANDFFLLCTDGILEQVDDEKLKSWFLKTKSPEELQALIYTECKGRTKDNFSMYLVKIKEIGAEFDTLPTRKEPKVKAAGRLFGSKSGSYNWLKFLAGLVLLCLLLGAVYYFGKANESSAEDPGDNTGVPQVRPENGQAPAVLPPDSKEYMAPETLETSPAPAAHGEEDMEAPTAPTLDVDQDTEDDHARPGTVEFDASTESTL